MGSTTDTNGPDGTSIDFTSFRNIINGLPHSSTEFHRSIDPSNGKPLWDVPIASASDLDVAVEAAQKAFKTWSKTKWEDRQEILSKLAVELGKYDDQMGEIQRLEGGKPIQFGKIEAWAAGEGLRYYASQGPFVDEVLEDGEDLRLTMRHTPIGVVGAICPWNFPLAIAVAKIAPALLTGSCVIVKPSPFTPYSVLKFAEIAQAFLPPGVLQAMNGNDKFGPLMTEHPGITKISFTGSSATGKRVMASAAKTLKRVTLELGGNSASIICPDVDVNKIAPKVALGAFFNSGQLCVASKRLYVHKDIYEDMLKALVDVVKGWKVGPTTEEGLMLGPVQNEMQHNIVKGFFEDSAANGYKFALPGEVGKSDGFVIQPAIVDNPPDEAKIVREEQFGPIVPMMKWDNEEELLARVNNTETGLGGAVWSSDLEQAQRIANQIEAGTVWINNNEMPLARAYMSGHKESGIGGEGGRHGLLTFMNTQVIHMYKSSDVARS